MRNLITILLALALAVSLWVIIQPLKKKPFGANDGDDAPIVVSDNAMPPKGGKKRDYLSLKHSPPGVKVVGSIIMQDYKPTPVIGDPTPFTRYYKPVSVYLGDQPPVNVSSVPSWELRIFACPVSGSYSSCPNPEVFRMGVSEYQLGPPAVVFNMGSRDFTSDGNEWIYNNLFIDHLELWEGNTRVAYTMPDPDPNKRQCAQINYCLRGNCKTSTPVNGCLP